MLEVGSDKFILADGLILVGIGHLHHHHATAHSATMPPCAMPDHAAAGTGIIRAGTIRARPMPGTGGEFLRTQRAILVGIGSCKLLRLMCGAIGGIKLAIRVGVHTREHLVGMGLCLGAGYNSVTISIRAMAIMVRSISGPAQRGSGE